MSGFFQKGEPGPRCSTGLESALNSSGSGFVSALAGFGLACQPFEAKARDAY